MDYKLELQNNNTDINNNNIDLNAILESINALPDAGSGLDTSDATATAENIEEGKTAYINGKKITGTIPATHLTTAGTLSTNEGFLQMTSKTDINKYIIGDGKTVTLEAYLEKLGDASPEDVISGKTFTSTAGLKVTGTHVCSGGIDTSDATATEADIISGKTAYVNGGKTTGTLVVNSYYIGAEEPNDSFGNDGDLYLVRGE